MKRNQSQRRGEEYPFYAGVLRTARGTYSWPGDLIEKIPQAQGLWHESAGEQRRQQRAARERAALMHWVERQMRRRLTPRERVCVELYYLREMTCQDIATATGSHRSSVSRAISRGLRKLRAAAREESEVCCVLFRLRRARRSRSGD